MYLNYIKTFEKSNSINSQNNCINKNYNDKTEFLAIKIQKSPILKMVIKSIRKVKLYLDQFFNDLRMTDFSKKITG